MNAKDIQQAAELLRNRTPRQRLAPAGPWNSELSERIMAADLDDTPEARALKAGLLLWNDDLDRSHTVSQDVETETGSYWHGIMHRMEGDYSNAKYWFRRVGRHPVFPEIAAIASAELTAASGSGNGRLPAEIVRDGAWDPYAFIDCVERAVLSEKEGRLPHPDIGMLERIQHAEVEILLSYCFRQAFGGTLFDVD